MSRSVKIIATAIALVVLAVAAGQFAPPRVLESGSLHLRSSDEPEWQEFEGKAPDGRELTARFTAKANNREYTIFIRQRDVKHGWTVQINGRKLGQLHAMEAELVHVLAVPAGTLKDGENTLSILPPAAVDDVIVGEIKLDERPVKESLRLATIEAQVTDADSGDGVPCRITIADEHGALAALIADPGQQLAVRPGVVYTRDGRATIGVQPGKYTIYATRGFEYGLGKREIEIERGRTAHVRLQIRREVPTPGLVSCDTHIHTVTHSGHGDATIDERMITIAGEGIELAVATDHNHHTDYSRPADRTQLRDRFTAVIGNEVTTKKGHFNAFPIDAGSPPPDYKLEDWPQLMQSIRSTPGVRVVVLNHPRNIHSDFQPFAAANFGAVTGEDRRGPGFTFDAVEVLTSAALQSDLMLLYRDWFALLNHGYRVAGVGSSDSHDVSRFILGQGRTYVACRDDQPADINVDEACDSFLKGKVFVSMGLLAQMTVNDRFAAGDLATGLGAEVHVTVTVLGPTWTNADRVELFANGDKIREQRIDNALNCVEKAKIAWTIPRPPHDVHLVAIASGPGVTAPYWAIPKPYQPTSRAWAPRVIGSTNPIWIDFDNDGEFTSPRTYAAKLIERAGGDSAKLLEQLAHHDEAVSAQTASLLHAAGQNVRGGELDRLLKSAPQPVRAGFEAFARTLNAP